MPRRARIVLPNVPLHIIQRGNNRQACFFADQDYQVYLQWLKEFADKTGCQIHSYVLMTNHVHLLITPSTTDSVGQLMKRLGQRYVQYINRTYKRSGTLWEGRFRSCLTQEEDYLLACYRYIELNPVTAGMVGHPGEYRWSSYGQNGQGSDNPVITPHCLYNALGKDREEQQTAYRELFRYQLDPGVVDEIRNATNGNYALGSERFANEVSQALGVRASRGKAGRPPNRTEIPVESTGLFEPAN
ncbi:MAG: putative transposase [Arenicella sp.]|jgi:putative transposase